MQAHFHRKLLAASLTLILGGISGLALAGGTQPDTDLGPAMNTQTAHVTLMLRLHNQAALEQYIQNTVTPTSGQYHRFINTAQFAQQYGATDADIAKVQAFLTQQGLRGHVLANHMAVQTTGTLAQFANAFHTSIHTYTGPTNGHAFIRPVTPIVLPAALDNIVLSTSGLDNSVHYRSHLIKAPTIPGLQLEHMATTLTRSAAASGNPTATGQPGSYTVGDVANFYNINPLYARGVTGKGSTVGIVTLSDFDAADAQTYWSIIGLTTKPDRITKVPVDGGAPMDDGSGETALDVEQSGGLAPDANVVVYHAPNSGNGFIDAFLQAVADNTADSISTSWGSPEAFNFAALNVDGAAITDTSDVGDLQAFHQVLMEAAAQGQSVFAASGDSGAFDTVRALGTGTGPFDFNAPLTVDSPASDPYMTAAGGTTVPVTFTNRAGEVVLSIKQESVWGWDYLLPFVPSKASVFSVGGGGGVSSYWRKPVYQWFTSGIKRTEGKQTLGYNDPTAGMVTLLQLPARFAGRNVPDISLNADPETGYIVVFDGSVSGGTGGTSFVAPQLNGISALLTQSAGHRVGFWNPQMYLLQIIFGHSKWSPFTDIRNGDNWFYNGKPGYEPGAGLGVLNVANFDVFLRSGF
ncbi:MAG: S53 family peptidase [Rhodanobacter sp.]